MRIKERSLLLLLLLLLYPHPQLLPPTQHQIFFRHLPPQPFNSDE